MLTSRELIPNALTIIAASWKEEDRGQIVLPQRGRLSRPLEDEGYKHVVLKEIRKGPEWLLSIYPRKNEGEDTRPIDFKKHGGAVIELPPYPGGWLGPKWRDNIRGVGRIRLDILVGANGLKSAMKVRMPLEEQLEEAAEYIINAGNRYPSFI